MIPSLQALFEQPQGPGERFLESEELGGFYGGRLHLPPAAPTALIANFVTSADGVATFDREHQRGAAAVAGGSEADRLVMAMLRSAADVILIGAATLRVTAGHRWTAEAVAPALKTELAEARRRLTGSSDPPPLVVVSAGGEVPASHAGLRGPGVRAMVITTEQGAARLRASGAAGLRLVVAGEAGPIPAAEVLAIIERELSPRLVLTEGGPLLLGSLLSAGLVSELFLTVAPLLAGRSSTLSRPGLVDGFAAEPARAPNLSLLSLRRAASGHLFFRYRLGYP